MSTFYSRRGCARRSFTKKRQHDRSLYCARVYVETVHTYPDQDRRVHLAVASSSPCLRNWYSRAEELRRAHDAAAASADAESRRTNFINRHSRDTRTSSRAHQRAPKEPEGHSRGSKHRTRTSESH
ncbi:hypothetical protein MRX96_045768 [Rhipicephalus microplus]